MNIIYGYVDEVVKPLADFLVNTVSHPLNTLESLATTGLDAIQSHPYTTFTVVGLGLYAMHRGNLRIENNRLHVQFNVDTPLGACRTSTTYRIGPKL